MHAKKLSTLVCWLFKIEVGFFLFCFACFLLFHGPRYVLRGIMVGFAISESYPAVF